MRCLRHKISLHVSELFVILGHKKSGLNERAPWLPGDVGGPAAIHVRREPRAQQSAVPAPQPVFSVIGGEKII